MTANRLVLAVFVACCTLLLHTGCEEETATPQRLDPRWFQQFEVPAEQPLTQPKVARNSNRPSPRITFDKVVHDFGNVGPLTDSLCEFGFTNTGDATLKIGQVEKTCGCTPFSLARTDYAPGESGSLKVKYYSDTQLGLVTKNLTIRSNDPVNPQVSLAIKARVISKVDYEPKSLSLLLKQENAGCPKITLTSTDGQPFSISHFRSTADFMTADYDPSVKATSFVLEPKIDMARLEETLNGSIEIGLTHPECKSVSVSVKTLPKFRITPIVARGTDPTEPIMKKVRIVSNYGENFAIHFRTEQNHAFQTRIRGPEFEKFGMAQTNPRKHNPFVQGKSLVAVFGDRLPSGTLWSLCPTPLIGVPIPISDKDIQKACSQERIGINMCLRIC